MASFDDNRDTLAAELFSKKPLTTRVINPIPPKEGLKHKFIKLERLRKQELARWWDITTLKRYLEIKQVPRGLRVIIFPSFEDLDPDLLGEWEYLISSTSFSMINILIKHANRKRNKLLLEIASLEEEIKNLNLTEATDKNYAIMKDILNGYQLYVKDKKMRKLIRDENDYSSGRIYTFARKFDQVNRETTTVQTRFTTPTESISGSLSDVSNLSSDSTSLSLDRPSDNTTHANAYHQPNAFLEELGRYRKGIRLQQTRPKQKCTRRGGFRHNSKHKRKNDNPVYLENTEILSKKSEHASLTTLDNSVQVINLSSACLSVHEINVLKKGLGFCPTSTPDYTNLHVDLFKFVRNLKLKKFFHNKVTTNRDSPNPTLPCNRSIKDLQDIQTVLSLDNPSLSANCLDELLTQLDVPSNLELNSGLRPKSTFVPILPPDNCIDVFYKAIFLPYF
ncbi:hypothetical protein NDU88_003502 [Pleurodeles waltl]|uniref:Uncharacterized protein n=1 Tax=Pleurodeles waltl TaxID=8319 RepID=A0AAV7SG11_PLEWA|nr:hypothetical protein NDU88_003502 [Pleurodeles waltl]